MKREKSINERIFLILLRLASATLLIRVVGMINQIVVTARFGAGVKMDTYFVASALPLLIAQCMINTFEKSVTPVYARAGIYSTKEQISALFSTLLNIVLVCTIILTLIIFLFPRQIIFLSAPALDTNRAEQSVALIPYVLPALLLMIVIGFLECILNTEGQFGLPAYAGTLVPISTVLLVLTLERSLGILILCIGMLVGLILQLIIFILRIRAVGIKYRPVMNLHIPEIAEISDMAWPALCSSFILLTGPLVDQMFASSLTVGSLSSLNYALKLNSVPIGVILASVGRAALPFLARQVGTNDMKAFKETLRLYLWVVGISTAVISASVIVLAHPIVQILFQRGAFTYVDTNRIAATLIGFMIGLAPMSLGFVTAQAFIALGKTKLLLGVTIFNVLANAIFDYIFIHLWQSFGIAFATSLVYVCTASFFIFSIRRTVGNLDIFTPPHEVLKMIRTIFSGTDARLP